MILESKLKKFPISILLFFLFSCSEKEKRNEKQGRTEVHESKEPNNYKFSQNEGIAVLDTLNLDVSGFYNLKISQYKNNTNLNYENGRLHYLENSNNGNINFSLDMGLDDFAFPNQLVCYSPKTKMSDATYQFHENSSLLQMYKFNSGGGNYLTYFFTDKGLLLASGHYHYDDINNYEEVGIWQHYNTTGNVVETVNAKLVKEGVLKHFGIEKY